jgi:hypothetical protein
VISLLSLARIMNNKSIRSRSKNSVDGFTVASTITSTRSRQLGRDKLLDEFTTRFVKTRSLLHERNEQCALLANEIPKYKKVRSLFLDRSKL